MIFHLNLRCLCTEIRVKNQKKEPKGGIEQNKRKSKSKYKSIKCHYCNKTICIQKYYFKWKKDNKDKKGKQNENDHSDDRVTTTIGGDHGELVNLVYDQSMQIIDNGAMLHVTSRKDFFISYTFGDFGALKTGNDSVSKVIGIDGVCLQTNMRM